MNSCPPLPPTLAQFVHDDENSFFGDDVRLEQQSSLYKRIEHLRRDQDEREIAIHEALQARRSINMALKRQNFDILDHHQKLRARPSSDRTESCEGCLNLQDMYGKTSLGKFRRSRMGCPTCKMILDALWIYSPVFGEDHKVRIFAPIARGNTLRIWYQGAQSVGGEISFMIELYVIEGQPSPWPEISARAEISGDTSSPQAFAKARYWLSDCIQNHDRCPSNQEVPLPTRLLFLSNDGERWHIRLAETLGLVGRYACLSHRWGDLGASELLETDWGNYEDHLKAIPIQSLPLTFQQAIASSRQLGLQFLWIDSLCIIQHDDADWRAEAVKMGSYCGNACITLAASWSPGPAWGCFTYAEPEFIGRQLYVQGGCIVHVRRIIPHGSRWPLLKRGWIYQERLLSPRVLHFGQLELAWECYTCTACECTQSDNLHTTLSNKIEHSQMMGRTTPMEVYRNAWRNMIQEYSQLKFTFVKDKFPALAGLAKQMQKYRQSDYYAGLWVDSFIGDLLWEAQNRLSEQVQPRELDNKAPTWSWASAKAIIISYDCVGTKTNQAGLGRCYDRIQRVFAKLLSIGGEPLAEGNSGESEGCHILLHGPCLRGIVQHRPIHSPPDTNRIRNPDIFEWETKQYEEHKHELKSVLRLNGVNLSRLRSNLVEFSPDYGLFHKGQYHLDSGTSVLVMKMAAIKPDYPCVSDNEIFCLVLRQLSPFSRTCERIGLTHWWSEDDNVKVLENAEELTLKII